MLDQIIMTDNFFYIVTTQMFLPLHATDPGCEKLSLETLSPYKQRFLTLDHLVQLYPITFK